MLLLIFILSGCSSEEEEREPTIVFKGEGTDWEATYHYYKVSDHSYDYEFSLTYKGDIKTLKDYEQVIMEYGAGTNRIGGTIPIISLDSENQTIFKNSGSFEGVNLLADDSKIDLYIQWGDNVDSFILTKAE